ncbi:MAG: DUF6101 family protein [Pseudomonadota bacterium]
MAPLKAQRAVANSTSAGPNAARGRGQGHGVDGCINWSGAASPTMALRGRVDEADRSVVITARLGGTLLMQRIPLNAYRGVVAELTTFSGGEASVRLTLCHDEPTFAITLEDHLAVDEAVAVWRMWADRLSVPLILRESGAEDTVVRPMLGAVAVGSASPRKMNAIKQRRPRFAKRRGYR